MRRNDKIAGIAFLVAVVCLIAQFYLLHPRQVDAQDNRGFEMINHGSMPRFYYDDNQLIAHAQYQRLRDRETGQEIICITTEGGWRGLACYPTGRKW